MGNVEDEVETKNTNFKLELSYPGHFQNIVSNYEHMVEAKELENIDARWANTDNFIKEVKQSNFPVYNIQDFSVSLYVKPSDLSDNSLIHLISIAFCESDKYGKLMAIGDRGGFFDFSGVQVYTIKEFPDLDRIKNSLFEPLSKEEFEKITNKLKQELVLEKHMMTQLKGYCGYQSSAELNAFSKSLFVAMHNVHSRIGKSLNLDDALSSGLVLATDFDEEMLYKMTQIDVFIMIFYSYKMRGIHVVNPEEFLSSMSISFDAKATSFNEGIEEFARKDPLQYRRLKISYS